MRKKYIYRSDTKEYLRKMIDGNPVWTDDFSKAKMYSKINAADDDCEALRELGFPVGVGG